MTTSSVDRLKEQIESIPATLSKALERRAKAQIEVARLKRRISKLEAEIEREVDEDDNDEADESDGLEDELALLKIESEFKTIKLQVSEAEDKAEMEFRSSAPKPTNEHVKAAVGSDPEVIRLRHECLKAEEAMRERKLTLQREKRSAREARPIARSRSRTAALPENEEMAALQEELLAAQVELILAESEVEAGRITLDTYKMLVQIESLNR